MCTCVDGNKNKHKSPYCFVRVKSVPGCVFYMQAQQLSPLVMWWWLAVSCSLSAEEPPKTPPIFLFVSEKSLFPSVYHPRVLLSLVKFVILKKHGLYHDTGISCIRSSSSNGRIRDKAGLIEHVLRTSRLWVCVPRYRVSVVS